MEACGGASRREGAAWVEGRTQTTLPAQPGAISHAARAVLVSETFLYTAKAFKLGFSFSSGKSERTIKTFLGEQERRSANWRVNGGAGRIGD